MRLFEDDVFLITIRGCLRGERCGWRCIHIAISSGSMRWHNYMYLLSFLIVMQGGRPRANAICDLNRNAENLALGLSVEQFIFFAR